MRDISVALLEHYNKAKEKFPHTTILGVFLYGSQNYNIATEDSDVDTIAILIPSFDDLVLRTPISEEIHFENGEHCVVKDIREVVKQWKKQSLNYLEILFTKHYILNPQWKKMWNYFVDVKEDIAHMNKNLTIKSIVGQAKHTFIQNRFDKKKQANALRMYYFLKAFLSGKPYEECLTDSWEKTLAIKTNKEPFPFHSIKEFFDELDDIKEKNKDLFSLDKKTDDKMNVYLVWMVYHNMPNKITIH